jgi:hypothetical protein
MPNIIWGTAIVMRNMIIPIAALTIRIIPNNLNNPTDGILALKQFSILTGVEDTRRAIYV